MAEIEPDAAVAGPADEGVDSAAFRKFDQPVSPRRGVRPHSIIVPRVEMLSTGTEWRSPRKWMVAVSIRSSWQRFAAAVFEA